MFTTKYRSTDGAEYISGPFERVCAIKDDSGFWTVNCHEPEGGHMQIGPVHARCSEDVEPIVWVMNGTGATVANYRL